MGVLPAATNLQNGSQPDSVLTVQDALMRVSQSQSMQDSPSGSSDSDMSQQMLIEALPPVLVLHLKRFRYDAAAGGVVKIGKPVQISPELDIPFGTLLILTPATAEIEDIVIWSFQTSWYPLSDNPRNLHIIRSVGCFTITASLRVVGTIRSMFVIRTEAVTQVRFG